MICMVSNYYYFVSGLPDILVDESKNVPHFQDFMVEAQEQLASDDLKIINTLRLPIDNRNLIDIIESNSRPFDPRGNYSKEELTAALRFSEGLPEYMQTFLEAHRENRQLFPGLVAADQLSWLFYEEVTEHENEFVREWFSFELNLRNVMAAVNCRKNLEHVDALGTDRDRPVNFTVVGRNDVAEAVLRSTAPDFGLSGSMSWVEKAIALSRGNLTEMEKGLDDIRWDMLNELTVFTYFQVETVAAFALKLLIVERWMKLDAITGRAKLDRLVEELKNSYEVPAGF